MSEGMSNLQKVRIGVVVLLAVLVIIVVAQNMQAVETRFLFISVTMPRAVLLALTLVIGILLGMVFGGRIAAWRKKSKLK